VDGSGWGINDKVLKRINESVEGRMEVYGRLIRLKTFGLFITCDPECRRQFITGISENCRGYSARSIFLTNLRR